MKSFLLFFAGAVLNADVAAGVPDDNEIWISSCAKVGCVEMDWPKMVPIGATLTFRKCEKNVESAFGYELAENGWRLDSLRQQVAECSGENPENG